MLTDWTDLVPKRLFARLKKRADFDNVSKQTVGDFFDDVKQHGLAATVEDRKMWGQMRMTPTDLSDVNGNTYTFLMNGTPSPGHWTGHFRSGEKHHLLFTNRAAMTTFDVRRPVPQLPGAAPDGQLDPP